MAAIRSHTSRPRRRAVRSARRSSAASRGSRSRARISGSVTVPSSRSAPRGLPVRSGGPETSSTSSRIWNASPIRSPKSPSAAARAAALERAELTGGAEQDRGLQPAALEVALDADTGVPRVGALHQLARARAPSSRGRATRTAAGRPAGRQLGERAREQQVAGRRRQPPAAGRHDGRATAAQRGAVEHVVVDERRAVDELDRDRGADEAVGLRRRHPGGEAHEQRSQALAAGRDRLAGVARQHGPWPCASAAIRSSTRSIKRGTVSPPASTTACTPRSSAGTSPDVQRDDPAGGQQVADPAQAAARTSSQRARSGPGKRLTEFGR